MKYQIPRGLMARILGFHPRGPGSIPGVGEFHSNFENEIQVIFFKVLLTKSNQTNQIMLKRVLLNIFLMFFLSHLISNIFLHLIKVLLNKKLHQIITKDFPVQVYYINQPLRKNSNNNGGNLKLRKFEKKSAICFFFISS